PETTPGDNAHLAGATIARPTIVRQFNAVHERGSSKRSPHFARIVSLSIVTLQILAITAPRDGAAERAVCAESARDRMPPAASMPRSGSARGTGFDHPVDASLRAPIARRPSAQRK